MSSVATQKQCSRCCQSLDVVAFAKCSTSPDGLQGYCRECQRAKRAEWYHQQGGKAKKAAYLKSEHGSQTHREQARRARQRNPLQVKARNAVNHAVGSGRLPPVKVFDLRLRRPSRAVSPSPRLR